MKPHTPNRKFGKLVSKMNNTELASRKKLLLGRLERIRGLIMKVSKNKDKYTLSELSRQRLGLYFVLDKSNNELKEISRYWRG